MKYNRDNLPQFLFCGAISNYSENRVNEHSNRWSTYLSGYMISALILFIALVSLTFWIVSLTKDPELRESVYFLSKKKMPIQKVFAVYTFGHAIIISWINNVTFQVNLQPKLKTDLCGHFGYFSESKVIIFAANGMFEFIL